ncbi:MAG TPA: alternative ribosome rescue aminoacyl-tRNA hydrolase ArfB [Longimicrobiales bacterium]|nr:alternative ribosome rescue aminoacyl-tRNA hydrolase ArfB [Longimicrobiales bacterium]
MSDEGLLRVDESLAIPRTELEYRATRSGGPGGQHVNTSSTRIELTWNVRESAALDEAQRARIMEKLASRIDANGVLRIVAANSRSQHQNRETATTRLAETVARALRVPKPRRRTKTPRAVKEARLQEKKRRSRVKQDRGPVRPDE